MKNFWINQYKINLKTELTTNISQSKNKRLVKYLFLILSQSYYMLTRA